MLTLDISSGVQLEYLAEGAANVVYRINPPPPSPSTAADADVGDYEHPPTESAPPRMHPELEGRLIRLRKTNPSTVTVLESHHHFQETIAPLFPAESLVEQILFIPTRALLWHCNDELRNMETVGLRPDNRHGVYLAQNEPHGLLLTDMSCSPESTAYRCIEFKPKWLVQSPTAPRDAKRCRTCALRHMKRPQEHGKSTWASKTAFCPLGLVSADRATVGATVGWISGLDVISPQMSPEHEAMRKRLVDFVYENPLLGRLRDLQEELGKEVESPNLSTAMTLRDCTLFLKVSCSYQSFQ